MAFWSTKLTSFTAVLKSFKPAVPFQFDAKTTRPPAARRVDSIFLMAGGLGTDRPVALNYTEYSFHSFHEQYKINRSALANKSRLHSRNSATALRVSALHIVYSTSCQVVPKVEGSIGLLRKSWWTVIIFDLQHFGCRPAFLDIYIYIYRWRMS